MNCKWMEGLAPYALRLGLGVTFVYHGYGKIFGPDAGLGATWNPHGMIPTLQILVSWGELLAGVGLLVGCLTWWASLGIVVIMAGAIVTVHGSSGFGMRNGGFEYNFVLICMSLAQMAVGSGKMSLDTRLKEHFAKQK